jgi:hypothetical protein
MRCARRQTAAPVAPGKTRGHHINRIRYQATDPGPNFRRIEVSTPDKIRTCNLGFGRPITESRKPDEDNGLRVAAPSVSHHLATDTCQTDPDLARIVDAWPALPDAIKAGILALVQAAGK